MILYFITDVHLSSVNPGSRIDDFNATVFGKLEHVFACCKRDNGVMLMGGDLFNTPTLPDSVKNKLKELILRSGVRTISIVGNHDLVYYNEEYIDRTSFMTLVSPGVIEYIGTSSVLSTLVGDWVIQAHEFGKPFPQDVGDKTIVLSHSFYNYDKEDRLSVHKQEVYKSAAKFVCFGHDHNMYPIEMNNGTLVVRPGALTRGTSHTENRVRVPSYAVIDTDTMAVEYRPVPHLDFKEVFREKYSVEKERVIVSFDEIQKFIDELKNSKVDINPYTILYSMGKRDAVVKRASYFMNAVGLVNQ